MVDVGVVFVPQTHSEKLAAMELVLDMVEVSQAKGE